MSITWNGVSSDTIGVIVERIPNRYVPTRRFSPQQVAGRNGNILLVDKAFPNVEQEYEVYLSAESQGLPSVARACAEWLMGPDGYCRLTDSYDTTVYREAFLMGGFDIENILNKFGRCTITFSCKPQKYLLAGDTPIEIPDGTTTTYTGDVVQFDVITGASITSLSTTLSPIQDLTPSEYQTVEYIESTGEQWIDIGLKANQNTGFSIVYYTNNELAGTEYGCIFGARTSSANNEYQLTSFSIGTPPQGVFRYGNQTFNAVGMQKNVIQRVSVRNGIIINADGISTTLNTQTFETPVNITLFALNQNGTITQNGKVRIYDIELYDGDALIAHMVPCYRISDNIIGMYDIVRKTFFTNGGTGVFIKGSNVGFPNPYNICPISGRTGLSVYVGPTQDLDDATVYNVDWTTQAGTVYGGTLDVVTGVLTVDRANIASYNGEVINEPWLSSMDEYAPGATPTTGAQVVYKLATPLTYQLTAQEVALLVGTNNVWSSSGDVSVTVTTLLGGIVTNPTPFEARPLLTVSGVGEITINGKSIQILESVSDFEIDCETMEAEDNSKIYCMDFPELSGGENKIVGDGSITALTVTPRWWTL